jgi:hypothetical protein
MNRKSFAPAAIAALALTSVLLARPARADDGDQATNVQVALPRVMSAASTSVMPGPTAATKYVVINMLRVPNISDCQPLVVDYKDFALRTLDGDTYHVDRKVTSKLPFSLSEGVLGLRQATIGSLAFQVPSTTRDATLVYYVDVCGAVYF